MKLIKANVSYKTDDGKKVNQTFYVDAETFGDAEERVYKELTALSAESGLEVKALGIVNFGEFVDGDDEFWFKAVIYTTLIDEVSAKEKKTRCTMLINGVSVESVTKQINAVKQPTDELIKVEKINIEGIIK